MCIRDRCAGSTLRALRPRPARPRASPGARGHGINHLESETIMPEHRFFAAIWDRMIAGSEKGGLADMRADLLRDASGRTLELGAGTGHNLPHYTDAVVELVLTEPDRFMAARLRDHLAAEPPAPASVKPVSYTHLTLPTIYS